MMSGVKFYKDFLLLDADSRRVMTYCGELDRNWDYGTVSVYEVGEKVAVFFWDDKKSEERIKKAIQLAKRYDVDVRRVTFK